MSPHHVSQVQDEERIVRVDGCRSQPDAGSTTTGRLVGMINANVDVSIVVGKEARVPSIALAHVVDIAACGIVVGPIAELVEEILIIVGSVVVEDCVAGESTG